MPLLTRDINDDRDVLTLVWGLALPADAVWNHLTDEQALPQWLGTAVVFGTGAGAQISVDHGEGYVCRSVVVGCDPAHRRFEVTWEFPDEHDTRVEVLIDPAPDGGAAVLTLRHHGLGELRDSYALGWLVHLTYFEASLEGTPLPPEQFWNVHATLSALEGEYAARCATPAPPPQH